VRRLVPGLVARGGVHAAQRVVLLAPGDPGEGRTGADRAVHDADLGQAAELFQPRAPDVILEGRLGHRGHARPEQQFQHREEDRQRAPGQLVAGRAGEAGGGVGDALLDLVARDDRAADRGRDLVCERRLAGAGRAANHDERRCRRAFQPTQVSMWLVEAGSGHDTRSVHG
jgi:hypothetical protein